jgi:hypothetical protein
MTGSKNSKIGLNQYLERLGRYEWAYELLHRTPQALAMAEAAQKASEILTGVAETGDIRMLLELEAVSLQRWLDTRSFSMNDNASIKAGLRQCTDALKALRKMENDQIGYKGILDTLHEKDIKGGLPLDAARKFFASHAARLQNLKPLLSEPEKRLIEQRQKNLQTIQSTYIDLQKNYFFR